MSFKCMNCKKQQPAGQPVNYVVTETRAKTYQNELTRGKMRGTMEESVGTEIVKQIETCPDCYRTMTGQEPRVVVPVAAVSKSPKVHQREDRKPWHNPRQNRPGRGNRQNSQNTQRDSRPNRPAPVVEVVNKITIVKE